LIGQIAWVVENMYFNVFLYNTITGDTGMIAAMVACSAVVATITTLLAGTLSDRRGQRKPFIVWGYLLWGVSVAAFALVRVDSLARFLPAARAVQTAAVLVVVLDCVMTFFGSTANDAAFNAWVTDCTNDRNRGRAEAVLAVMPLLAMLVVFGLLDGLTANGRWGTFFLLVGLLTMAGGGIGQLLLRESPAPKTAGGSVLYGLRPSVIAANPALYLSLLALAIYAASQQVYMPYLIIYIQRYLGVDGYAVILGVVLLASSAISILCGRGIDRRGKRQTAIPAAIVAFAGLVGMFFARSTAAVIAAGTVMLGGSMVFSACLQGLIRDYTPAGKAGQFQGIRIVFQVLLPMVTGPYIGSAVIGHTGLTYNDLGTVKEVPTPEIFIAAALVLVLAAIPLWLLGRREPGRRAPLQPLLTEWGEKLDRDQPLPEYPRPQLRRDSYLNLNGRWEYAICPAGKAPDHFEGEIIVPFSPESLLSGVGRQLMPGEELWYRRGFTLPEGFRREREVEKHILKNGKWETVSEGTVPDRVLLHFGAVDQVCRVFLNGELVGGHAGGYLPFTLDITDALSEGVNTLAVAVRDDTSQSHHAYGKQSFTPGGIWYTPQSGIWQTVWLEAVPENHVESLTLTPDFDQRTLRWQIHAKNPDCANVVVRCNGEVVAEDWAKEDGSGAAPIREEYFHPWSPEDPFLYDITVSLNSGDVVQSYFAMRKFGTAEVNGKKVFALNNKPYFLSGVLDQGYWPDGLYTAPSDEAMAFDIQTMKDLGFTMLRKHIKIEPLRWYYHCDRLGMIVWQDMVSGGKAGFMATQLLPLAGCQLRDAKYRRFGREDEQSRDQYALDLQKTVELLYNTPCIAVWVPFNEGWGQFDSLSFTQILWELDPTRLVDHASGWHDQGGGDFKSRHVYFRPVKLRHDGSRSLVLSEFGGYSLAVPGHTASSRTFGYRRYGSQEELLEGWRALYEKEILPCLERQALSGAVYTQLSDVEEEVNGILTYDRKVCKLEPNAVRSMNRALRFPGQAARFM